MRASLDGELLVVAGASSLLSCTSIGAFYCHCWGGGLAWIGFCPAICSVCLTKSLSCWLVGDSRYNGSIPAFWLGERGAIATF